MTITYAGQPLLLEDPGRRLGAWIERTISLKDLRLFGAGPFAIADGRWVPRSTAVAKAGLPTANWSVPPRMKLNTFWFPTGASRWSIGLFLCDKTALAGILENISSDGSALLVISDDGAADGTPRVVSLTMHLLPPRPLTALGGALGEDLSDSTYERLFLLPLVDRRYFWQWKDAGDLHPTEPPMSWEDLIEHLRVQLDEPEIRYNHADFYLSGYGYPDPVEMLRPYENAAILLDAVAWSLGLRVVLGWDYYCYLMSPAEAEDFYQGNIADWQGKPSEAFSPIPVLGGGPEPGPYIRQAGTSFQVPRVPEALRVVYPIYRFTGWNDKGESIYEPDPEGRVYALDCPQTPGGPNAGNIQRPIYGCVKTLYDTAGAFFVNSSDTEPSNLGDLKELTDAIAWDYYNWRNHHIYDISYQGLKLWAPTGYDDAIWWHWGYQHAPEADEPYADEMEQGPYTVSTRVASLPENWDFAEVLHYFPPGDVPMPPSSSSEPPSSSTPSSSSEPPSSSQPSSSSEPPSSSAPPSSSEPPSQSEPPPSEGSDKSSAIVPASWSPTGYVALFIHEMPEVRFDDVMVVTVPQEDHEIAIDPHFVEVCQRGTIEVLACVPEKPVLVAARALTDKIRLRFAEQDPTHAVRLAIRVSGIRRGFAGKRFPRRTREQFEANERFINSAYPSDPKAQ